MEDFGIFLSISLKKEPTGDTTDQGRFTGKSMAIDHKFAHAIGTSR
jgi:hypothetical protein